MLHPVFFTSTYSRNIDIKINSRTAEQEIHLSKVIHEYLHVEPAKGVFIVGQDTPQVSWTVMANLRRQKQDRKHLTRSGSSISTALYMRFVVPFSKRA
jgi:D-hexose-6-phosphate mutarotase